MGFTTNQSAEKQNLLIDIDELKFINTKFQRREDFNDYPDEAALGYDSQRQLIKENNVCSIHRDDPNRSIS